MTMSTTADLFVLHRTWASPSHIYIKKLKYGHEGVLAIAALRNACSSYIRETLPRVNIGEVHVQLYKVVSSGVFCFCSGRR